MHTHKQKQNQPIDRDVLATEVKKKKLTSSAQHKLHVKSLDENPDTGISSAYGHSFNQMALYPPVVVQSKLTINQPNDIYEQEADAMADKVMRMPASKQQPSFSPKPIFISQLQRKETTNEATVADTTIQNHIGPLNGRGRTLTPDERSFFEPRFDYDFSNVQLHTNAEASESAKNINALAYTHGNNIVFDTNQYQPGTDSGKRLLAHELTHVVQQAGIRRIGNNNSIIQRQAHGETQPAVDNETLIRNWFSRHQLAPPENQPANSEPHVLLNGEDMLLTRAVQLAVADLHQPPELITRVINTLLLPRRPIGSLSDPIIGPGNSVPGTPSSLLSPTSTGGVNPIIGRMLDLETIDRWLEQHQFGPPEIRDPTGQRAVLDGQDTTIEAVADRALAIAGGRVSFLTLDDVLIHLRRLYVAARGGPQTQIVFGYTLVPGATQAVTPSDTLHTQHQFSFTITRAHHAGDSPGRESSFQGSVSLDEKGQILNIQAGGQEAIVAPLLRGWIQVSGFVQLMAAANWNRPVSGTATISPSVQLGVGGQVLITPNFRGGPFRFLNGHVQAGIQVVAGVQATPQGFQAGVSGGLVINIPFNAF